MTAEAKVQSALSWLEQAVNSTGSANHRIALRVVKERLAVLEAERARAIEMAADEHDKGAEQWRMNQDLEQRIDQLEKELAEAQSSARTKGGTP